MSELYWITRLDALAFVFGFMIVITVCLCVLSFMAKHIVGDEDFNVGWKKCRIACFVAGVLGVVFIPTKNEALLILGVGGTIDYIKTNDTIQQLPDKCVDALDAWVDSLSDDKKEGKK